MDNSARAASLLTDYGAVSFETSQGFETRATLLRLTRQTAVFEVYGPESVVMASEVLRGFKVAIKNRTVYSGKAVVKNLVTTGMMLVCEAALGDGWLDLDCSSLLTDMGHLSEEITRYLHDWHKQYKVLPEYKVHIADMQMFFMELRLWLDQVELRIRSAREEHHTAMENEVTSRLTAA